MTKNSTRDIASAATVTVLFVIALFIFKTMLADSPKPRAIACSPADASAPGDLR